MIWQHAHFHLLRWYTILIFVNSIDCMRRLPITRRITYITDMIDVCIGTEQQSHHWHMATHGRLNKSCHTILIENRETISLSYQRSGNQLQHYAIWYHTIRIVISDNSSMKLFINALSECCHPCMHSECLTLSAWFTSALAPSSTFTTDEWPSAAAQVRAVRPSWISMGQCGE
jgi:hypothetical protein